MNKSLLMVIVSLCVIGLFSGCSSTLTKSSMPETTHDGLVKIPANKETDWVYLRPDGIDLSGYKKVKLDEPQISFVKGYLSNVNQGRMSDRLSSKDLAKMIENGKELFTDVFIKSLQEGGITLTDEVGEDVLLVKASITDLDIYAPDPNKRNFGWVKIYTEAAGRATLTVELYDSVTEQILVRAVDTKRDIGDTAGFRLPRDHYSNIRDSKEALEGWASVLTDSLNRAMTLE